MFIDFPESPKWQKKRMETQIHVVPTKVCSICGTELIYSLVYTEKKHAVYVCPSKICDFRVVTKLELK